MSGIPRSPNSLPAGKTFSTSFSPNRRRTRAIAAGMTLLELTIACAILLILATTAVPLARVTVMRRKEENLRVAAETIELAITTPRPPVVQLRSAITALVGFLGGHPGVCAGLLSFAGAAGRLGTLMAAKDAKLATPLRKLLDEGAANDQFTFSDSRDAANAILGAAMIANLTRWEDGRDTQDPEFQQALTDQLVRSVGRA